MTKKVKRIAVKNTLEFFQKLAYLKLKDWKKNGGKVISLTGSNGKTTNKEILFHILSELYPEEIHATKGNFNNHMGVPLTIFDISKKHRFAIIEIGTNHPGEIESLCEIAQPDFGFITNIGDSHLEFLIDRKGVLEEKSALFHYLTKNSKEKKSFLKNNYDPLLATLEKRNGVFEVGKENENQISLVEDVLQLVIGKDEFSLKNEHINEEYNLFNLGVCTVFLCQILPEKKVEILQSAANVKLPKNNRSVWLNKREKKIFLDAYNANPSSMEVSLQSFLSYLEKEKVAKERALFILGDMNELGETSVAKHKDLAHFLYESGIKNVAFIGRYRKYYQAGFPLEDLGAFDVTEFSVKWPGLFQRYDFFFIKGSRSVELEKLVEML